MPKFPKSWLILLASILATSLTSVTYAQNKTILFQAEEVESTSQLKGLPNVIDDFADDLARLIRKSAKVHVPPSALDTAQIAVRNLRVTRKPTVSNGQLKGIFNNLFRNQSCYGVVSCGIIAERTGKIGSVGYVNLGIQEQSKLGYLIQNGALSNSDRQAAVQVWNDLNYSLNVRL
ncbi:MAG: hypothetical protein KME45_32870 [Stenomitos rutilans HA7619-LM2]|jgi:hypothetical protein|nr:hypothetical protein [Stenomitos rutilans HA7619-LM2]